MNVLMMTILYPHDQYEEVTHNAKDKLQNQINSYQHAFVEGVRSNLQPGEKLSIFNSLPVGVFPLQYRQLFLKSGFHDDGTIWQNGCINLPLFKQTMRFHAAYRSMIKWAKADPNNRTILVYTQYLPYMKAIVKAKKHIPDLKAAVIVTDLPNEMMIPSGRKGLLKKIEYKFGRQSLELLRKMDGYVLLSEPMADPLQVRHKPYTVIEGLILSKQEETAVSDTADNTKPYFLYTGTLGKVLGTQELLDAFAEMPQYDLRICGHGTMKSEAEDYAKRFENIHYHGFVSHEKALAMQAGASGLLNPRQADEIFTRYSFPSKTLEYMRSGKPVLCCRLEGIPSDYDPYLCYMEAGKEGIIRAVHQLMTLSADERERIGKAAQAYVFEHKNPAHQCVKLLQLLRKM